MKTRAVLFSFAVLIGTDLSWASGQPGLTAITSSSEAAHPPAAVESTWLKADRFILQGLDKVSARVFTAETRVNESVWFGTLEIYVRAGFKTPPEESPEAVCFIEIYEHSPKAAKTDQKKRVFGGWLFASSPSLFALDHPVYDVWLKDAIVKISPSEQSPEQTSATTANLSQTVGQQDSLSQQERPTSPETENLIEEMEQEVDSLEG